MRGIAMQCPKCQQFLPENVRFCPHDGTPLLETNATRDDSDTPTGGRRPAAKDIELPVVLGGRYRLEELRGGGGMAKVYRAVDQTLEREVAVKVINPDLRNETEFDQRFQREARIASQLADPNIVVVHDFGIDAALGPFLVMEYLRGQSLRERLRDEGKLPVKAAVEVAGRLFLALVHAHDKGIVHRDIKPDNVFLLNQTGVKLSVRVLDFGIARIYRRDDASHIETITNPGAVLGTPRYMSPEQLAGNPVDARTDLYSAALVVFESMTGVLPYAGSKRLCEICPDAPPSLQEVLEHCLRQNSAERPESALEVYIRLQEAGKASGILMMPPGGIEKLIAGRRKALIQQQGGGVPTERGAGGRDETTQVYPGDGPGRLKRRLLIGMLTLIAVLGLAALGKWLLFTPPQQDTGTESVLKIHLGETSEDSQEKFGATHVEVGNPWRVNGLKDRLGHILQPDDLNLPEGELAKLITRFNNDKSVCVLYSNGKVVAVVASRPGARTNASIGVGSSSADVMEKYSGEGATFGQAEGNQIELRRYPKLGLGFEFKGSKVVSVTLFPPKQ